MKNIISLLFAFLFGLSASAQYTEANSFMRKAIVNYTMDNNGFYVKNTDQMVNRVDNVVSNYAYDVKSQNLYVLTNSGNYVVTLTKEYAKIVKKNKDIPHLKEPAIEEQIAKYNAALESKFSDLNAKRTQHIADSIAKAKADSIAKAKADSIARVKAEQERKRLEEVRIAKANKYRSEHSWHYIPIGKTRLDCTLCDHYVSYADSVYAAALRNDTIYALTYDELALGVRYFKIHKMPVPTSLKSDEKYKYHLECYRDSLNVPDINFETDSEILNYINVNNAIDEVKKTAPYGYFVDWGWNDEYSMLSFHFEYMNMAAKTIKYIDVYFAVTNDVGDVRKTGNFKGTGPVEQYESGRWNWDSSHYFVSGDVTNMNITKVIITYMDGSQKVLSKNMLRFDC